MPSNTALRVWNASNTPVKSGISSVTSMPTPSNCRMAAPVIFFTSFATGTMPRSVLKAIRFVRSVPLIASTNDPTVGLNESGSSETCPAPASSISATSATERPIGPSTQRVSKAWSLLPLGTTPGPGLRPTTPLNPAGVLKLPPRSLPVASHTWPVASADADPPEDPPALLFVFHGFRVTP